MQDVSLISYYKSQEISVNVEEYREQQPLKLKNPLTLALFILHLLLTIAIWSYAYKFSIIPRISHGVDFRADVCHQDHLQSRPYLYYPVISKDVNLAMCLSECPDAIADTVCLYDEHGTTISQSHLCYQTIQSKNQGKYCMPYESYSSNRLQEHIKQHYRIASDLINLTPTILFSIIISMILCHLVHLLPLTLMVYILPPVNTIILGLLAGIGFIRYLQERKKCLVGQLDPCNHGTQYLIVGSIFSSLTILYIIRCILHYKHTKPRINTIKKRYLLPSIMMLLQLFLIVFTGSTLFMLLSHSQTHQQISSNIDSGYYKIIKYGTLTKIVLIVLFYLLFDVLEHVQYFLMKYSALSLLYHMGQVWLQAMMTIKLPLGKIYNLMEWTDQEASYSRYLQQHLLHPFLWLWHYAIRYFRLSNLCVYGDTLFGRLKMGVVVREKVDVGHMEKIRVVCWHMVIFVSLIGGAMAVVLTMMEKTLLGYPNTLIESKIVGPVATVLLCLLVMRQHCYRMWWEVEILVEERQLLKMTGKNIDEIQKNIVEVAQITLNNDQKPLEITKQNLNQHDNI